MANVEYTGIKTLSEADQATLNGIATRFVQKTEKFYPDAVLRLIIKASSPTAKKSVQVTAKFDNPRTIAQANETDFAIADAVHKVLTSVEAELQKQRLNVKGKGASVRKKH